MITRNPSTKSDCETEATSIGGANGAQLDAICSVFPTDSINVTIDPNSIPDLTTEITELNSILALDLAYGFFLRGINSSVGRALVQQGRDALDDIPEQVDNITRDAVLEVQDKIEEFQVLLGSV